MNTIPTTDPAKKAAEQLEAYFLRRMFAELPAPEGGLTGKSSLGATFQDMFHESLADAMAAAGGIGLADQIKGQLDTEANPTFQAALMQRPATLLAMHGAERAAERAYGTYRSASPAMLSVPVAGGVNSPFGLREDPIDGHERHHAGVDLGAPMGAEVAAAGGGVVVEAGARGGYGNMVVIDHGNGLETRYAHLSEVSVKEGERITGGARVGSVGETGRATGPHLHFEVRRDGRPVDPKDEILGLKLLR